MSEQNNAENTTKCNKVGYIRISNPEKQNPMSQRKLMVDQGITPECIFEDYGSGSIEPMKRTAYKEMMAYLGENHEITEVIMSEYSRLGRTVVESLHELLSLIRKGVKVTSLSKSEQMINEIPATWQPVVLSLMMGSAQTERDHIRERTKWGLQNARATGKTLGRPVVKIDFDKVKETMVKYNLKEAQAIRVCGIRSSTYYKHKKVLKQQEPKLS